MNERVSFPAKPMVGVVGVATGGETLATGQAGRHGGNLDDHWHGKGARIFFPVRQPGGMFAVGDMHAAMGDGEICFTGVEIAGEVDIRFDLLKGKQATWPVTELPDRWVPHATAPDFAEALAARLGGGGEAARRRARLHDRRRVHLPLGRLRRRRRAGVQAGGGLRHDRALLDPRIALPGAVPGVARSLDAAEAGRSSPTPRRACCCRP